MRVVVAADRPPRLPRDAQDDERDGQPDERVGDRDAEGDDRGGRDDAERHVGVRAGVVAVGDEGGAVQPASGSQADEGRDPIARVPDRAGEGQRPQMVGRVGMDQPCDRLVHPQDVDALGALALAGALGFAGNWAAAMIRTRAGRRLDSPALVADGDHARADAYVSLGVIASAVVVALGARVADPLIGLAITLVILRITWRSWGTVRGHDHHHHR